MVHIRSKTPRIGDALFPGPVPNLFRLSSVNNRNPKGEAMKIAGAEACVFSLCGVWAHTTAQNDRLQSSIQARSVVQRRIPGFGKG